MRLATVRVDGANAKGFVADKRNATADLDSKFPRYTKKKQQKKKKQFWFFSTFLSRPLFS